MGESGLKEGLLKGIYRKGRGVLLEILGFLEIYVEIIK